MVIEILNLLKEWQTLIGSILGGIFALFVALIVARSARRREEISSGIIVIGNLVEIRSFSEAVMESVKKNNISTQDLPLRYAEALVSTSPKLSPFFEASISRIMSVDTDLATHLTLFLKIYQISQITLKKLSQDFEQLYKNKKPLRPENHFLEEAKRVTQQFQLAVEHATCAERIISDRILGCFPTWKRFRRFVFPNDQEKECKKQLKNR